MKSYSFLFWAYNVIWLGLAVFMLFLVQRLRGVSRRLEGIERSIDLRRQDGKAQGSSDS